jgi:hypothetical protein
MRLNKLENGATTLAIDTAITFMEQESQSWPTNVRARDVEQALIMLRSMRSKLLREAANQAEENTDGKQ